MRQLASLGNVGFNVRLARYDGRPWGFYTYDKQPTSVSMTGVSDIPLSFVSLFRNSVLQARSRSDASGNWGFYDMDDSGSQVYTVASFTQDGPTGELWSATVVGSTVTVTKLFSSQRAIAQAFA